MLNAGFVVPEMQDFQSIPGPGGRIFSGGGADHRRVRSYPGVARGTMPEPPAKCPRCESTNTKFCYYNNYNQSQPRHFCKACRRYWTNGGVLRSVPVGGGCRKSSSSKRSSSSSSKNRRRAAVPSCRSSSDGSSLTAADASTSASASFTGPNPSPDFDTVGVPDPLLMLPPVPDINIFSETGSFTSLLAAASAGPSFLGIDFSDPPLPPPLQHKSGIESYGLAAEDTAMLGSITPGFFSHTVHAEPPHQHQLFEGSGIACGMDWPGATAEQPLFDFTSDVGDQAAYWNHSNWGDADPSSLYFP